MKDIFGENLLGDVFSEIASEFAPLFGGTIQIIRPGEGERRFDRDEMKWVEPEPRIQHVPFNHEELAASNPKKSSRITHVGTVPVEAGDLVGIVAGAHIDEELQPDRDKLRWNGKLYQLKAISKTFAGDTSVLIQLLGGPIGE